MTPTASYDAFGAAPANAEPCEPITPAQSLVARNGPSAPGGRVSRSLNIGRHLDAVPQKVLDRILWQAVHGRGAAPPPPAPTPRATTGRRRTAPLPVGRQPR